MDVATRIARLDLSLFDQVEAQLTDDDRRSLLAIHDFVARSTGVFSYLEIGSFRGGTLQPVVVDERCNRIISIDPRPQLVPDDRPDLDEIEYEANTTAGMIQNLSGLPGADLQKLITVELSTEDIAPGSLQRVDWCFIDGEHTDRAALRDARFCRTVMQGAGLLVFHDFHIVEAAIAAFLKETTVPARAFLLPSTIFVIALGSIDSPFRDAAIRRRMRPAPPFWEASNRTGTVPLLLLADKRRRARR